MKVKVWHLTATEVEVDERFNELVPEPITDWERFDKISDEMIAEIAKTLSIPEDAIEAIWTADGKTCICEM